MPSLSHEKLIVYKRSIEFNSWAYTFIQHRKFSSHLAAQFHRAMISIPLNIAEGNGKYTSRDKAKYYDIAKGSALECGACLDLAVAQEKYSAMDIFEGKEMLIEIVSMLTGLAKSTAPDRVREDGVGYGETTDQD